MSEKKKSPYYGRVKPLEKVVDHIKSDQVAFYLGRLGYEYNSRSQRVLKLTSSGVVRAAADACGVDESAIYQWLKSPEFRNRIASVRTRISSQCLDVIQHILATSKGKEAVEIALRLGELVHPEVFNRQVQVELFRHKHRLELLEVESERTHEAIASLPQPIFTSTTEPEFPPANNHRRIDENDR